MKYVDPSPKLYFYVRHEPTVNVQPALTALPRAFYVVPTGGHYSGCRSDPMPDTRIAHGHKSDHIRHAESYGRPSCRDFNAGYHDSVKARNDLTDALNEQESLEP